MRADGARREWDVIVMRLTWRLPNVYVLVCGCLETMPNGVIQFFDLEFEAALVNGVGRRNIAGRQLLASFHRSMSEFVCGGPSGGRSGRGSLIQS